MKKINVLTVLLFTMMFVIGNVQAGTVAYWPFDDGTATDASGNGADGVLASPVPTAGYSGGALEFDGDDEVEIATGASLDGDVDFSVSAWIKTTATAQGVVIQQRDESGGGWNGQYRLQANADGLLSWYIYNGGYGFNFTGTVPVNDGEWHHIVGVRSGPDGMIYVDGELDSSGTGAQKSLVGAIKVGIGCDIRDNNKYFVGTIDEVYVFDHALTTNEISALYYLDKPLLVAPDDGGTLVPLTQVLEWSPPDGYTITGYDVYFGTEPNFPQNPQVVFDDPATTYAPTLANDTTYYWRVDAIDAVETHVGNVWSFTTAPAIPVVTTQPGSLTVADGDTAVFTIESITTDSYQWYYSADGVTSTPISGAITNTLTVTSVTLSDEGYYYCDATNTFGTVSSDSARLMTKRLVAHWALDGDLSESVDGWVGKLIDPNTANPDPTPVFDVGADGTADGAIKFTRNTFFVEVLGSEDYFNFFPQGQTVNLWVKPDVYETVDGFMSVVGKQAGATGWEIFDTAYYYGQGIETKIYPLGSNPPGGRLDDGDWHMITVTYDVDTQAMVLYQDGSLSTTTVGAVNSGSTSPVVMGGRYPGGAWGLSGLLDDVSIRSYAIGPYEVAKMYTDVMTGESVCVDANIEYDFNNNCIVDLGDFAIFAQTWLNCNSVAGINSGVISCN